MTKPIYKEKYPMIFSPMEVRRGKHSIEFKNRVLTAPMNQHLGTDADGIINDYGMNNYIRFAMGGFASICLPCEVPEGFGHLRSFQLGSEVNLPYGDMHKMQHVLHAYRCLSSAEIYHPGFCQEQAGEGFDIMSADTFNYNGKPVRGMNEDDMEKVAEMHAHQAHMAKRAGFDFITLHYGHGWLCHQFLSPLSNHRKDKYGGSIENCCRFPLMILERIREVVGDDLIIEIRMNGSDGTPGGIENEMAIEQARIFADKVDMIHFSCGHRMDAKTRHLMEPSAYMPPAHNVEASALAKKANLGVKIGLVGAVHEPDLIESILEEEKADYILMGRQAQVEDQFMNKLKEGREEDIRPCLLCAHCIDTGRRGALSANVTYSKTATYNSVCPINPLFRVGVNRNRIPLPKKSKNVVVIGGGISGMQAAVRAAELGHRVTLFEKTNRLGGQLEFCEYMWFKRQVKAFVRYMTTQLKKQKVNVIMNTEATREMIENLDPDAVLVAVGSDAFMPPIEGIDGANVINARDVFGHEEKLGKKIAIVGGGNVGCEMAIYFDSLGKESVVVEMGQYLSATSQLTARMQIMEYLEKGNITTYVNTRCVKITDKGIYVVDEKNEERFIEADTVVISAGSKIDKAKREIFKDVAFDVINIGDCYKVGDLQNAIHTAWDAATTL